MVSSAQGELIYLKIYYLIGILDIDMGSPDDSPKRLQGASRISGGTSRGHAQGNVFNLADAMDVLAQGPGHRMASRGKVYVYTSPLNPTTLVPEEMKPMATVKVVTSETIAPMLQQVSRRFSPVRSKYIMLYVEILF